MEKLFWYALVIASLLLIKRFIFRRCFEHAIQKTRLANGSFSYAIDKYASTGNNFTIVTLLPSTSFIPSVNNLAIARLLTLGTRLFTLRA